MISLPIGKLAALLFASVAAFWTLLFTDVPLLRFVVGAPLLLLLPGYATITAIFPQRALDAVERLLFSIGISVGLLIVSGLVLHCLPTGLQRWVWAVGPVSFILLISAFTLITKSSLPTLRQRLWVWPGPTSPPFGRYHAFLIGLAMVIVAAAISLARTPAPQQGLEGYTMLWISPGGAGAGAVRLGVRNMEFTTVQYQLHFEADDRVFAIGPVLTLKPGETWERQVLLPAEFPHPQSLTISLYRLDVASEPYRRVIWWSG